MVDFLGEGTRSILALGGDESDPLLGDGTRSIFGESEAPAREYDEIDAYQDVTEMMALAGGPPTAGEVEQQNADARYKEGQLRAYQQLYEESPPGNVAMRAVDTAWFDLGATLKAFYYDAIKGDPDAANKVMQSADARRQALAEFDDESVLPETLARGVVNTPSSLATSIYGAVAGSLVGNPVGGAIAAGAYRAGADARAETLADGGTEREANITGLATAGIEAVVTLGFGAAGKGGLEDMLKSGVKWRGLRTAASQIGAELSEENIIEQLSMSVDGVVRGKWPTAEERVQAAIDTTVQTLLGMGAMTGASKVIDFIENPSRKNAKEVGLGDVSSKQERERWANGVRVRASEMELKTKLDEFEKLQASLGEVDPDVAAALAGPTGTPEFDSVIEHNRAVYERFASTGHSIGDAELDAAMPAIIALHDIGKPDAVAAGDKARQHEFSVPMAEKAMAAAGYTPRQIEFAKAFIGQDVIGKAVRNLVEPREAAQEIRSLAAQAGLSDKAALDLAKAFYYSDAGSYAKLQQRLFDKRGELDSIEYRQLEEVIYGSVQGIPWSSDYRGRLRGPDSSRSSDRVVYRHASARDFTAFDPTRDRGKNLVGPGAYLLPPADAELANAYAKRAIDGLLSIFDAKQQERLKKATKDGDNRFLDSQIAVALSRQQTDPKRAAAWGKAADALAVLRDHGADGIALEFEFTPRRVLDLGSRKTTGRVLGEDEVAQLYAVASSISPTFDPSKIKSRRAWFVYEGIRDQIGYAEVNQAVQAAGYDAIGFIHSGHRAAGAKKHAVVVALDFNAPKRVRTAPPSPSDAVAQAAATAAPYNAQAAPGAAGITPGAQIPAQPRTDVIASPWRSDSPAVEAAIEGARFRPTVQSRWEQLKESAKELAGAFRSRRRFLDEKGNAADATTAEYLRLGEAARSASKTAAVEAMAGYMKPLGGPEQYGLFSRVLLLRDLKRDIDSGKYGDTGLLPFSYDDASQVEADLAKAEAAAQATPAVAEALAARQAFIHGIRDMAVARKLLPEDVKDFDDYYHHQVIAYLKGSELVDGAAGATSLEDRRAGWQRGRKKLDPKKPVSNDRLNYNTEFLDAEYAVVSSMLYKMRMAEVRDAIQGINDIKPRLQEEIEAEREQRESRKGRLERQLKQLDPQNDAEAIAGLKKELDAIETESDMKRTWRDLVPEGYVVWQPDKGSVFFRGLTVAEDKLAELVESILASVDASFIKGHVTGERAFPSGLKQMLDTIDIPDIPGIRTALMVGGKKPEWVIPEHVAKELDAYGKSVDPGPVSQFSARVMQMWKRWQLNAPHRFLKYNLNNASGDTDILLAAAPKVLTFLPQAYREVKKLKPGKALTGDLAKAIEHGVIGSGFTSEIDTQGLSQSEVFDMLQGRLTNDVSARVRRILNRTRPEHISEWRENVYRFAAYKHFLGEIKAGRRPWGVTPFQIVEALYARGESPELIAARLSRDLLGDYGNRTVAGEYIRRHLIPFYSFQEINFQRYWNLFKNAVELGSREDLATTQGNQRPGDIASAAGKAIGKRAAYRTLQAGTMAMMYEAFITMYNKLVWPEEDRELAQNGRDQLHLILGRDREGNIITLRMQGAFSDVLGTFGLNVSDVLAVYEGDRPITDVPKETLKAASGKLVNSSLPIAKTIGESLIGYTLFPDPYEPRPLRDPREHMAGMAMPSWFYRKFVSDVPQRVNSTADLVHTLITYSTDPAEASYFASRHLVSEFLKQDGREDVRWAPNAKSNAIYYHKQAIKYGDDELAEKWLQEYKRLGGTAEGYKQSIKSSHPLSGLNAAEKKAFASSLTPEEKEVVKRSIDWYNRIYNKPPTPAR